jgi:hypothetical protein
VCADPWQTSARSPSRNSTTSPCRSSEQRPRTTRWKPAIGAGSNAIPQARLRPSNVTESVVGDFVDDGVANLAGPFAVPTSPISVHDLGAIAARALERGPTNAVHELFGPDTSSLPDVIRRWTEARHETVKLRGVPLPAFRAIARLASPVRPLLPVIATLIRSFNERRRDRDPEAARCRPPLGGRGRRGGRTAPAVDGGTRVLICSTATGSHQSAGFLLDSFATGVGVLADRTVTWTSPAFTVAPAGEPSSPSFSVHARIGKPATPGGTQLIAALRQPRRAERRHEGRRGGQADRPRAARHGHVSRDRRHDAQDRRGDRG